MLCYFYGVESKAIVWPLWVGITPPLGFVLAKLISLPVVVIISLFYLPTNLIQDFISGFERLIDLLNILLFFCSMRLRSHKSKVRQR